MIGIYGIPQNMSNILLSIILTDISENYDKIILSDYLDLNLQSLMNIKDYYIYCRKIPAHYINILINFCIHFNNNDYKCNSIMEKLIYIIYYYIQDKGNRVNLYNYPKYFDINDANIMKLRELYIELECIKPVIRNMLKMILEELDEYIMESKKITYNVMKNEMNNFPLDLIGLIVDFIPELYLLNVAEMF